jgi:hypothetical protein
LCRTTKGKWLPSYLKRRIELAVGGQHHCDLEGFERRVLSSYLAALDCDQPWARRSRDSRETLVTPKPVVILLVGAGQKCSDSMKLTDERDFDRAVTQNRLGEVLPLCAQNHEVIAVEASPIRLRTKSATPAPADMVISRSRIC